MKPTARLELRRLFGPFVSGLKIPFPGNGDLGSKRRLKASVFQAGAFRFAEEPRRADHCGRESRERWSRCSPLIGACRNESDQRQWL
jgi:hypothetical protein